MIRCKVIKIEHTPRQRRADMSDHLPLEILLGLKLVERILFPQTSCLGGDTRCQDLDFFFAVAGVRAGVVEEGTDGDACLGQSVDAHRSQTC